MPRDAAALLEEALKLPSEARARLAAELLGSLDGEEDTLSQEEYEAAWREEIARRTRDIESGADKPVPWPEARRQILSDD